MSMFSGRYKQMFFSSNLKVEGNLNTNTCVAYCRFPVLTYARKYCNLSPVTSTEDVVQHFTQASIRKMQPVTESQQKRCTIRTMQTGNSVPDGRSKLEERYS